MSPEALSGHKKGNLAWLTSHDYALALTVLCTAIAAVGRGFINIVLYQSAVLLLLWAWCSLLIEAVTSSAKLCVSESAGVSTKPLPASMGELFARLFGGAWCHWGRVPAYFVLSFKFSNKEVKGHKLPAKGSKVIYYLRWVYRQRIQPRGPGWLCAPPSAYSHNASRLCRSM